MAVKNKISGLEFDSIRSDGVPAYGWSLQAITRSGVDGALWRRLGRRGESFTVTSSATFRTLSEANRAIGDYEKLLGTSCQMELQNRELPKVMVLAVRCSPPAELLVASNGAKYEVKCNWELYING